MTRLESAVDEINRTEKLSEKNTVIHKLNPMAKFIVVIGYIAAVTSVNKYSPLSLLPFGAYPLIIFILGEIPVKATLKRVAVVLPFIIFIGLGNVIFDKTPIELTEGFYISGGAVSLITILLKGLLTVTALCLFISTTGFYGFSRELFAIRGMKIPAWVILLLYRYIILLLEEVDMVLKAYSLRSGGNKVSFKSLGSMLGLLFFRMTEKAERLYGAMKLKGMDLSPKGQGLKFTDIGYILFFSALFIFFRIRGDI